MDKKSQIKAIIEKTKEFFKQYNQMRRLQKEYHLLKDGLIFGRLKAKEKEVDKLMDELNALGTRRGEALWHIPASAMTSLLTFLPS